MGRYNCCLDLALNRSTVLYTLLPICFKLGKVHSLNGMRSDRKPAPDGPGFFAVEVRVRVGPILYRRSIPAWQTCPLGRIMCFLNIQQTSSSIEERDSSSLICHCLSHDLERLHKLAGCQSNGEVEIYQGWDIDYPLALYAEK